MNTSVSSFSSSPSTGGRKKTFSRSTPSIARQSIRTEVILEENGQCVLKAKNTPVPVQVQELLRAHPQKVSLQLDPSGWAWIVCGYKTYIWKYSFNTSTSSCIRLSLPHTETSLSWSADLLVVIVTPGESHDLTGIVGVSPNGRVYFWKHGSTDIPYKELKLNVSGTNSTVQSICKLERSECFAILTNDGAVHILSHTSYGSLRLDPPQGMLSGIGKRFSMFLFGGQGANREPVRLLPISGTSSSVPDHVCVLTKSNLLMWRIMSAETGNQQMQYDVDVSLMIRDGLVSQNWFSHEDPHEVVMSDEINVSLMDCQISINGLVVLFAACLKDDASTPQWKYGLVLVSNDTDSVPYSCDHFIDVSLSDQFGPEPSVLEQRMLASQAHSQAAIFCSKFLIPIQLSRFVNGGEPIPSVPHHRINMDSYDAVIGSGTYQDELLFFSREHGIVSLMVYELTDVTPKKRAKTQSSSAHKVVSRHTQPSHSGHFTDLFQQETEELKNAFMLYMGNDLSRACSLCSSIFSVQSFSQGINTPGDVAVMRLSEMLLNDVPTSDPRWGDISANTSFTSTSSLIIIHQLKDKLEAHNRFVQFLSDVGLLDKLTCLSVRGKTMKTGDVLCENAEKIVATMGLKQAMNSVIDDAIKKVLKERPLRPQLPPGLTPQDIYFSQVANIEDIFEYLIDCQNDSLMSFDNSSDIFPVVLGVANAIQSMFNEAILHRQSRATFYVGSNEIITEYLPWTACGGRTGGRGLLIEELNCLVDVWNDSTNDPVSDQNRQMFWNSYCLLAKQLFQGYQEQIQSIREHSEFADILTKIVEEFNGSRDRYINYLFDNGQVTAAVELAEEFHHFLTLVKLCQQLNDRDLLKKYFDRFKELGFGDSLFQYYRSKGDFKELMSFAEHFPEELDVFLKPHDRLAWIHYLNTHQYTQASQCLKKLATNEEKSVSRKKTMLSIAKLAVLAAKSEPSSIDCSESMKDINCQLEHIKHHEQALQWKIEYMQNEKVEFDTPPTGALEVVELYIKPESAGVDQFLCALEFVSTTVEHDTEEFIDLLIEIWSHAILHDKWDHMGTDDILAKLEGTFLMAMATQGLKDGLDIPSLLPDIDDILHCGVLDKSLTDSNVFRLLFKAAYEHINSLKT